MIVVDRKQRLLYSGVMATKSLTPDKAALSEAIEAIGGQAAFAKALAKALKRPVSQQWVSAVLNRPQKTPAEWVLPIERATRVQRHRVRPDLYPSGAAG